MKATSLLLFLPFLLNSLVTLGAYAVKIQLFEHANFTGLVLESSSTGNCNNIPKDNLGAVYSIRTDTCFIAYNERDCKSFWSDKHLPGDTFISSIQLGRDEWIHSLQTCNEEEGGHQLNLDMTEYHEDFFIVPAVLESYKNVCSCVNVPQYVQNMSRWSIDNHHNDLLAYYERDCSVNKWKPEFIPAGHNYGSRNMHDLENTDPLTNTTYKIQSFGPDPNSTYFQTSNCKLEVLAAKNLELQTQFDQLKRNQEKFQSEMLQKHNHDFKKLSDKFTELEQQCRNVTHKIKSDLHEMFA